MLRISTSPPGRYFIARDPQARGRVPVKGDQLPNAKRKRRAVPGKAKPA
jgi:hypothetical protein